MTRRPVLRLPWAVLALLLGTVEARADLHADAAPPLAARRPRPRTLHGETVVDDYAWLRDKKSPAVRAYLRAEAAYAARMMAPTRPLQDRLYREILSRTREDDATPPYRQGAYEYVVRTRKGQEHAVYCRRAVGADGTKGPEEVILDLNALAPRGGFIQLGTMVVSDDGSLLAYSLDRTGHEDYTLYVKDLRSGRTLPDRIPRVSSVSFATDGRTLVYAQEDATTKHAARAYRHVLGQRRDALIYAEPDPRFEASVSRSSDDALLFISSESHTQTEIRYLPAGRPDATPTLIAARAPEFEYDVDHGPAGLYVRHNGCGPSFCLSLDPLDGDGPAPRAAWKTLVAHDPKVMIEDFQVFADYVVLTERVGGATQLEVYDVPDGKRHRVAFDEPVHDVSLWSNLVFATPTFRFVYESPTTPPSYYDYDARTRVRTLVKRDDVPGDFDPARYVVSRVEVPSGAARIPVSIVEKRGTPRDGTAPLLLQGYGAYGVSYDVGFSESRLSMLDRGVVFAYAHIRGGGELGKAWHDDGRMLCKQHSFEDFLAVARWLVDHRYTRPDRLAAMGGSAGGLLMGAVVNRAPELFRAVVAEVPFVDVINTMLDESIPLTVGEFEEWGNPKRPEHYRYMRGYCPYENVRATDYPAMLVTSAENDARAPYWEAAKWVARLRAVKTDHNPLIFRIETGAQGHGGPSGRYEQIADDAYEYAFVLTQLRVEPPAAGASSAAAAPASR